MDNLLPTGITAYYAVGWLSTTTLSTLSNPSLNSKTLLLTTYVDISPFQQVTDI